MKRLILTRHAKSSWDDPLTPDHDRPLNERGKAAAADLGTWLASRGYAPGEVTGQHIALIDQITHGVMQGGNPPVGAGVHLVLHLHGFQNHQQVALFECSARFKKPLNQGGLQRRTQGGSKAWVVGGEVGHATILR